MDAKQLIESLQDGGKQPAELIRDWLTGQSQPGKDDDNSRLLHEETGGDVEFPETPDDPMQTHPQEEPMNTEPSTFKFTVETAEQQVNFREMINALDSAQAIYRLQNEGNEWTMTWQPNQDEVVENVLDGLGIEFEPDDTPEALYDYFGHGAEDMSESELAIEALLHGATGDEVINAVCEKKKKKAKKFKPTGWVKKALAKGGKEFKTTSEYPTEPQAKRAIVAGLLKKLGKASRSGGE